MHFSVAKKFSWFHLKNFWNQVPADSHYFRFRSLHLLYIQNLTNCCRPKVWSVNFTIFLRLKFMTVSQHSLWSNPENLMQCRFGRLPFEARIPLGNCNCTTRLRSYTLDRNIVRRSVPGMSNKFLFKLFKIISVIWFWNF